MLLGTSDRPCPLLHRLEEVPLEVLRQRESKWLDMLNNWDKWMAKKHIKVRDLAVGLGLDVAVGVTRAEEAGAASLEGAGGPPAAQCPPTG